MTRDAPAIGTVVILNGTASAGKTSVAHALQEVMEEPYFEAGIDRYLGALPRRYFVRPRWDEVLGQWTRPGCLGGMLVPAVDDLEVDTSVMTAAECATRVAAHIGQSAPFALKELSGGPTPIA